LRRKVEKALALPGAQNAFRRMHLNEWTEQAERWIDLAAWDACDLPVDLEHLRGRRCFGGLDLSTTTDVTALAWVFPPEQEGEPWRVLSRRRRTCAGVPSVIACPTIFGLARASSKPPRATWSITARSRSGSSRTAACSTCARSPTTPGTPPTLRCASRARARRWSSSAHQRRRPVPRPPDSGVSRPLTVRLRLSWETGYGSAWRPCCGHHSRGLCRSRC
jgi:hypothetical protein